MKYNEIRQVENRVKRYWYADGIVEMVGGGLCLLLGLYFIAQEILADGSFWRGILSGGFVLLIVTGIFVTRWLVNHVKTRVTYRYWLCWLSSR